MQNLHKKAENRLNASKNSFTLPNLCHSVRESYDPKALVELDRKANAYREAIRKSTYDDCRKIIEAFDNAPPLNLEI